MLQKVSQQLLTLLNLISPIIIVYIKHTNLEKLLVKNTLLPASYKKVNEYMCFYLIKYKLNKIEANIVRLSYH